ncbi:MAG: AAA family ATPase, partial [Spirochaetales bacterium]|nr:AAA family ATPase [Spirochaetales bacterium]
MIRKIYPKLLQWKNSSSRKPLVLKGARQTGKTYLLNEFGRTEFRMVHYINFQSNPEISSVFDKNLDPFRILEELEFVLGNQIDRQKDLLFFDEIQDCPKALTS